MQKNNPQQIANKLQQLFSLLQRGQIKTVLTELGGLLKIAPNNADVYHLAGLAYKADNQEKFAIEFYQKSLTVNNLQPQVHNNLANVYKQIEEFILAEKHYKQAIAQDKTFIDAYKNLGLLHVNKNELEQAEKVFLNVLQINNKEVSSLTSLGNIHKSKENYEEAIKYYQSALAINSNYVNALHNLGLVYKLTERFDHALSCFQKAKGIAPNLAEIDYNEANTLFEQGDFSAAEKSYWSSLSKSPEVIEVHQTLNEFYWQLGRKSDFGRSFQLAIDHLPNNMPLRHAFADSLFSSGNSEKARQVVEQAIKKQSTPQLLHLSGKLLVSNNELAKGMQELELSLTQQYSLDVALDFIELLIIDYQYEKALSHIAKAELIEPLNQLLLAYKSTCWRLCNDERFHWLVDYQSFIKAYEIPVPNGYASRTEFLNELQHVLLQMHNTQHEPLKQTLKHGTQTPGRLFYKPFPQIMALKNSFEAVVYDYIDSLPNDSTHPLLSRKTKQLSFAGSWSVKLKPNGFHVNHVHPQGWLSSSFYVNVPDFSLFEQPSEHAGSIRFGESSMGLKEREEIGRIIAPSAGTAVIFPSYMWHGTFPFNGGKDDFRLTAPCDVIPLN